MAVGVVSAIVFGCMCRNGRSLKKKKKRNVSCLVKWYSRSELEVDDKLDSGAPQTSSVELK